MGQPGLWCEDVFLSGYGHLPKDMAAVYLPTLHRVTNRSHYSGQLLLFMGNESLWQEQHSHISHSLPAILQQTTQDHYNSSILHTCVEGRGTKCNFSVSALQGVELRWQHRIPERATCCSVCSGIAIFDTVVSSLHIDVAIWAVHEVHATEE